MNLANTQIMNVNGINYTVIDIDYSKEKKEILNIFNEIYLILETNNSEYKDNYDYDDYFTKILSIGYYLSAKIKMTSNMPSKIFNSKLINHNEYILTNNKLSNHVLVRFTINKKLRIEAYFNKGYIHGDNQAAVNYYEYNELVKYEYWKNGNLEKIVEIPELKRLRIKKLKKLYDTL